MLNINNLNRARKILSAQQGIKASFNTPDEKIKFCGKYGPYYKYSFGDVGTEDWNNGDVFSDLPPDKFYESEGGSAYLPPLEYADGVDPNNIEQPIYKGYGYDKEGNYYYGVTQSEEKQRLSSEDYYHLMDQKGLIDWNMKEDSEREEEMENKMLGLKSTTSTADKEKKQSNTAQSPIQSLTPSAIQSPAPSLEDYTKNVKNDLKIDTQTQLQEKLRIKQPKIESLAPKVDTNLNILSKEEETFAKEKLKHQYSTTYGLSKEQRQDIKDRYAWSKENPDKDVADFEHYDTQKEMKQKLEATQPIPKEELGEASSLTPPGTYTTQPTTPVPQNTTITTPQITKPQIQGNPSGTDTSTEEQPEQNASFLKGQASGQKLVAKVDKFLKSEGVKKAGEFGGKAAEAADIVDNLVRSGNDWAPQTGFENTWDKASTIAMKFGPLGKAIGGGMKVAKVVSDLFGSKTQDFIKDTETLETVGGSYGGSSALIEDAANKAGKKYGLFASGARRRANRLIDRARVQQYAMQGIADDARDLNSIRSYMDPYYLQYESDMSGGYDQRYMHVAKLGGTLTLNRGTALQNSLLESFKKGGTIEFKAEITGTEVYDSWEPVIDFDEISLLKEGGSIKQPEIEVIETNTVQKSVIPDGALHKNKHNLDKVGVDDKEMTKKGIPVVDNNGEQQAEIELNEIIFTLEVTKELEKRYKEYYDDDTKQSRKDELALEAGKLLWKEIIYNTDDRTGLIDTLKHGGSITKSKENNTYQDAIDFYKNLGYTPQNYEFIKSSDLRTEGNKLYVNTDEDAVHELWHFISKNIPDERFQEFYKDLSDSKISELGGDLKFVNRTGNPQEFYDPSELLARLFAAKYKTQGNSYTKEFFKNARANETKYGYNFRDLLHMYNDDNLVKLFSFKLNNEHKKDNTEKRPFEDWIITVNPDYISPNYDLETAYKYVNPEQLKRWRSAVNSDDPEKELKQRDAKTGKFVNHLPSIAPYGEGDYIFLKKGTVDENPEVQDEINEFINGKTGLEKTHELIFNPEENRYFYIKKSSKFKNGGNLEEALQLLKSGGEFQIIQDDVKTITNDGDYELTTDKDKLDNELEQYFTGTNGIMKTHDLIWDNSHNRYFYRKKVNKKQLGGLVDYTPVETDETAVVKKVRDSLNLLQSNLFPEYAEQASTPSESSNYYTPQPTSDYTPEFTPSETTSESTQVPDNLNLDGWDLEKTLKHLREHAHDKSTHYCARYVRQALEAGGLVGFRVPSAKDEVKLNTLASIGFKKIAEASDNTTSPGYTPQAGDIAITFENGNHAAMYDGTKWISDFRQKGLDVYHNKKNSKAYIYRRVSNNPSQLNTILINKTSRTLSVGDKVFKVSISKKGIENTSKKGDNLTPEGEFTLGEKETKGGYNDPEYGDRPNAYGGKFYRLSGGSAEGRGFGIHGSDQYNDPDNYQIGKYGTHGCIAMKNADLEELEQIIQNAGGPSNFKVKIIKASSGTKFPKVRALSKIILNK